VQERALQEGLLLLSCGVYGNVIRFLYPLTIPEVQFRKALDIISLADTLKPHARRNVAGLIIYSFQISYSKIIKMGYVLAEYAEKATNIPITEIKRCTTTSQQS
jgi:hypothetical protein